MKFHDILHNRRIIAGMVALSCLAAAIPAFASETTASEATAGEAEKEAEIIEISNAEELAAIKDNLSGNYVLTADIDLGGAEWTPIGSFVPKGESDEEAETPSEQYAFTGTFDGGEHTISNYVINQPEGYALGLFGCIADSQVGNFIVKNADVEGAAMVADVIGYSYSSTVYDIELEDGTVNAHATDMSSEGMYGGVVGAGMDSRLVSCTADADITIPDGAANAGIVGGGLEMTSLYNCKAEGSVTAGSECYGLGSISGCGFGAQDFLGCEADNVTITAGDNCFWIGGITGYGGGFSDEKYGIPVTVLTDCSASNVKINTGSDAEGVGDIIGAGFYNEETAKAMGEPFDQPTEYVMIHCITEP